MWCLVKHLVFFTSWGTSTRVQYLPMNGLIRSLIKKIYRYFTACIWDWTEIYELIKACVIIILRVNMANVDVAFSRSDIPPWLWLLLWKVQWADCDCFHISATYVLPVQVSSEWVVSTNIVNKTPLAFSKNIFIPN